MNALALSDKIIFVLYFIRDFAKIDKGGEINILRHWRLNWRWLVDGLRPPSQKKLTITLYNVIAQLLELALEIGGCLPDIIHGETDDKAWNLQKYIRLTKINSFANLAIKLGQYVLVRLLFDFSSFRLNLLYFTRCNHTVPIIFFTSNIPASRLPDTSLYLI